MGEEEKSLTKEPKIFEKVDVEDYRGLLSIMLVGGYVAAVVAAVVFRPDAITVVSSVLGPLAGAVVGWYFREKSSG